MNTIIKHFEYIELFLNVGPDVFIIFLLCEFIPIG